MKFFLIFKNLYLILPPLFSNIFLFIINKLLNISNTKIVISNINNYIIYNKINYGFCYLTKCQNF